MHADKAKMACTSRVQMDAGWFISHICTKVHVLKDDQDPMEIKYPVERFHSVGDRFADLMAKKGATMHPERHQTFRTNVAA